MTSFLFNTAVYRVLLAQRRETQQARITHCVMVFTVTHCVMAVNDLPADGVAVGRAAMSSMFVYFVQIKRRLFC
jgi:hypothetical protein